MPSRITVITAGHLSTCPRMLKAADAFARAGYRVRVVSTRHEPWADRADREVMRTRSADWTWAAVDYRRAGAPGVYAWTGARRRAAHAIASRLSPARAALSVAARAYSRVHAELVRAALAAPADLFYGGTTGALAAVAEAGRRSGTPYAIDLEDFHGGEHAETPRARTVHALARRIEGAVLPDAAFATASSAAIAAAYRDASGVAPVPIHNTFPLPSRGPETSRRSGGPLRLYWFSQTIGPGRGLEDVVRAVGVAGISAELALRGRSATGYLAELARLASSQAPRLAIIEHEPAAPESMVDLCRAHDVGLAVEPGSSVNNRLALSNKALTYPLAGLAVAITDTPGQRPLAGDLGDGALVFAPGDVDALARGLRAWADDREALARAQASAWDAARRRWHWEHPDDRGALLDRVRKVLG